MARVLSCSLEVSEFELHSRNYVDFQTKALKKCMNASYPPPPSFTSYGLNDITASLLLGWL